VNGKLIKKLIFAAVLTLGLALATIPSFRNHIFYLSFVDEEDNIVIGNYVSEGKKLYQDVFSQHQPTLFLLSAGWQKIIDPDNIRVVVKRHREFMIVWSIVWVFFLTARFGLPLFLVGTVLELTKIDFLGSLFLAESIVLYPLIYIVAYVAENRPRPVNTEIFFVISLIWFVWFSLAPVWPLLGAILLFMIYESKQKKLVLSLILLIGLSFVVIMSGYIGIRQYWTDTIFINYKYYIPLTTRIGLLPSLLKAFLAPIYALWSSGGALLSVIKVLSLGFIIQIFWLIKNKLYGKAILFIAILGLSNLRYIDPSTTLYGAFHMLPWFGLLIFFNILEITKHKINIVLITMIFIVTLGVAKHSLWDKRDINADYYINFSPLEDIRKAVEIIASEGGHTVWLEPVQYWPHWRTGVGQYTTMVNYYGWMDQTPPLKQELDNALSSSLPTIVWAENSKLGIGDHLSQYTSIYRDGKAIHLYLRSDKISSLSPKQRQDLSYYRFEIN
jgi:hypothetical protein